MFKRIIIQDYGGYPFPVQLSRKLAKRGHSVLHIYAGFNNTPRGTLGKLESDPRSFEVKGLYIRRPLQKFSFVKRWLQEREYGYLAAKDVLAFEPDVVISANMPLDAQAILEKACGRNRIRFVYWWQDVISIATRSILGRKIPVVGNLIGDAYISLEKRLLRTSDHIVLISGEFESFLSEWGVPKHKTTVIQNWAPLNEMAVLQKNNPWSREHGLEDKFCFLYSGTLGMKHNPEILLNLALHFKHDPSVIVFVGSEGLGADWLRQKKMEIDLPNLILQGFQPMEKFSQVLAAGDVLLAILEPDAGVFSVPSKVLSYLCARRALLLSIPVENLAARIVAEQKAGLLVKPGDMADLLQKADTLYWDPELRRSLGQNARAYAEEHFDIETIADQFEALLQE